MGGCIASVWFRDGYSVPIDLMACTILCIVLRMRRMSNLVGGLLPTWVVCICLLTCPRFAHFILSDISAQWCLWLMGRPSTCMGALCNTVLSLILIVFWTQWALCIYALAWCRLITVDTDGLRWSCKDFNKTVMLIMDRSVFRWYCWFELEVCRCLLCTLVERLITDKLCLFCSFK